MSRLKGKTAIFAFLAGALLLPPAAHAGLDRKSLAYLKQATASLYSMDYGDCQKALGKIIAANPDSPFGYLFEAGEIWWQYSNPYVFSAVPAERSRRMIEDVTSVLQKSRPMLDSPDPGMRADGNFASGMALGLRGQWSLLQGHWLEAYFQGRKSLKFLRACLAADPSYYDADLGLGIYDYEAAKFGKKIKLGYLLHVFGSEKNGLRLIALAKNQGDYSSRQAAAFLLTVYLQDKRDYRDAMPLAQELRQEFPQSAYFESAQALIDYDSGLKDESFKLGEDLFRKFRADPKAFEANILNLACSFTTDSCLGKRQMSYFMDWINGSMEKFYADKNSIRWLVTLRLLRGYSESLSGGMPQAQADFHAVLEAPNLLDYHARARRCLSRRCDRKSLLAELESLAGASGQGDDPPSLRAESR